MGRSSGCSSDAPGRIIEAQKSPEHSPANFTASDAKVRISTICAPMAVNEFSM